MNRKELLRKFIVDLETMLRDFNREFGGESLLPVDHYVESYQNEICLAVDAVLGFYGQELLSEIDEEVFGEGGVQ